MIDELIELCLPIFRDNSLDDDQRPEEVQRTLSAVSTLRGQQLESLTLRVVHLCRERIQAEETLKAASSPLRPPSAPRMEVDRPSRQSSYSIELPDRSGISLPVHSEFRIHNNPHAVVPRITQHLRAECDRGDAGPILPCMLAGLPRPTDGTQIKWRPSVATTAKGWREDWEPSNTSSLQLLSCTRQRPILYHSGPPPDPPLRPPI